MKKNDFKESFLFSVASSVLIGLLGGLLFAIYDIAVTVARYKYLWGLYFAELLSVGVVPLLFWLFLWLLLMLIFGNVLFVLTRLNDIRLGKAQLFSLQVGVFFFLAILSINLYLSGLPFDIQELSWGKKTYHLAKLSITSLLFGLGAAFLADLLLKKAFQAPERLRKGARVLLGSLIIIAILFLGNNVTLFPSPAKTTEPAEEGMAEKKPNIIWIVMDTVRADHLSCYGYERDTTPRVCELAEEGVLYENAISAGPWTFPAHNSMFTGMYPSKHGAVGEWHWLDDKWTTIAEVLKENGYSNLGISNNDYFVNGNKNMDQGFDEFINLRIHKGHQLEFLSARLIDKLQKLFRLKTNVLKNASIKKAMAPLRDSGARTTNAMARQFMEKQSDSQNPFLLFINYMEGHGPHGNTPEGQRFAKDGPHADDALLHNKVTKREFKMEFIGDSVPEDLEKQMSILSDLYDGDLYYLDSRIGKLMDFVREQGVLDDTIVIITADHGENFGEHRKIDHLYDIHRPLTHVPLIVRFPEAFSPGERVGRIVETIDIFPTLLDLLSIDFREKEELQGHSLLDKDRPSLAFSEASLKMTFHHISEIIRDLPGVDPKRLGGEWKSVHAGDYEYVHHETGQYLYNLLDDPLEENNLIDEDPAKAAEMKQILLDWLDSFHHYWEP